ncbi:uncharacterized protein V6R79_019781 [Siganus canaliculatus]
MEFFVMRAEMADEIQTSQCIPIQMSEIIQSRKQTELAELQICIEKRAFEATELDIEIKQRTLRKLDLEIQKLEANRSRIFRCQDIKTSIIGPHTTISYQIMTQDDINSPDWKFFPNSSLNLLLEKKYMTKTFYALEQKEFEVPTFYKAHSP